MVRDPPRSSLYPYTTLFRSAMDGQPPSPYAVQAAKELGIDISGQRSRMLTPELVQQADYILGMTHSHIDTVMMLYPRSEEHTSEPSHLGISYAVFCLKKKKN